MLFYADGQSAARFDWAPPIRPKRSFYLEARALTAKQGPGSARKKNWQRVLCRGSETYAFASRLFH
jgi:hypothetical protein